MVDAYHRSFNVPAVIVRPFNTFGPRQSARAFIPTVITQALTQEKLALGSLDPVRDMTFVKDTVEGFITVGLCDKVIGQTINLGVGKGETIGTMVKTILRVLGREDMVIEQDPSRVRPPQSEVMRLISDNTKARQLCEWQPRYSLEEGISATIDWTKKNIKKYRSDRHVV
jgi:nucleoside-diphosphate-sugar epimerase